jgi:phosphotransferase system enzyme I (PtsI)
MRENREIRYTGVGVSEGVVVGRVLRVHDETRYVYRTRIDPDEMDRELRRFRAAVRLAKRQLLSIKERAEQELGKDHAYIFDAHLLMLEDQKLISDVEHYISEERSNAEWALKVVCDRLLAVYSEIKDDYLRERGSDIEDVVKRLLVALSGEQPAHRNLSQDAVIVSQDLLPSAVAELDLDYARAVVTDTGGWTSHMAIVARGLGIPAVVGLRDFYWRARTGDTIIVDSDRSQVILHPGPDTLEKYRPLTGVVAERPAVPISSGDGGLIKTLDGVEVTLRANVELPAEYAGVKDYGAHGIGLYRSEFLLSRRGLLVSEEQQYKVYSEVAKLAGEHGAIIRLFDLGAEKQHDAQQDAERNPALGLRAIRFGLAHDQIMRTQLRAILRAAAVGKLDIVLPMIADVADIARAVKILDEERLKLDAEVVQQGKVQVGAMIEIPSAVLTAHKIAARVAFFELGTNDLIQYTLAVDRGNEDVADWFRTLHPAVLYSIKHSIDAAKSAGIPVIVCGEMASTPAYAVLLIGLGAVDLSMTPPLLPRVRLVLSRIDSGKAREIANECLECATADQVENLVRQRFLTEWPDLFSSENLPTENDSA